MRSLQAADGLWLMPSISFGNILPKEAGLQKTVGIISTTVIQVKEGRPSGFILIIQAICRQAGL